MSPAIPFMATAVLMLPVVGVGLALTGGRIGAGETRGYPVLVVNHLLTLGWGMLAAMGSLHQLFPAMIGAPLRPGRVVRAQFWLSLTGALLLAAGFFGHWTAAIAAGAAVAWTGTALFLWLVLRQIRHRRRWLPACTGVVLALLWLAVAVTWGLVMGVNIARPFWPRLLTYAGVGTHAAAGIGGWFVQLVVSVSYYLLPRFTGLRRLGAERLGWVLLFLNLGIALLLAAAFGAWPPLARGGVALLAGAGILYAIDLSPVLRLSRHGQPDLTLHHWRVVWIYTLLLSGAGLVWSVKVPVLPGRALADAGVLLLLTGWVTLAISGQLYKVTPFLMWYYRFARGMSALEVPRLEAPYYPRAGVAPFYLTVAGSATLTAGRLVGSPLLGTVGGLFFLSGALALASLLVTSWLKASAAAPSGEGE